MKKFTFSLRNILVISFILLGGLPILIMGFIALKLISADIARDVRSKNLLIARSLSMDVHGFLDTSFSLLKQIEDAIIVKQYISGDIINPYLDSIMKIHRDFESVEILDEKGTVQFISPTNPDIIGINRSGQQFFSSTMERQQPYWSPTFVSIHTENLRSRWPFP